MSYTAPQYVDTKEQAILALASTIKGEAVTGGDGSVNRALDILADVLAEQDVQVPQTDAGAILALADYVSGGGGGSSDFTTARVTVTSNEEITPAIFEFFHVCTMGEFQGTAFAMTQPMTQNLYIDVILYKGASLLNVMPGWDYKIVSTSGAIQQMDTVAYMISGDCTITLANA